jgi:hypothetical protein
MRPLTTTCFPILFLLAACNGDDDTDVSDTDEPADTDPTGDTDTDVPDPDPLAIAGEWADSWGSWHVISDDTWTQGYPESDPLVFHVSAYDNEERWVVAQNDAANEWNPSLYSRFDWTVADGTTYFCQTAYDAATEADALAATPADASDLMGGCGGFSWTALWVPLEIRGTWDDSWGGSHTIDEMTWVSGSAVFHVTSYDNDAGVLIAQNDEANDWNPNLWSRYDWTWSGTQLFYCQTAYGAASEAEAEGTPRADDTDLAAGCGGFGWTELTAPAE